MTQQRLTDRGFQQLMFDDSNANPCILQQSSQIDDTNRGMENPGSSFLWAGVSGDLRMHLNRDQVELIVKAMQRWLDTGKLF